MLFLQKNSLLLVLIILFLSFMGENLQAQDILDEDNLIYKEVEAVYKKLLTANGDYRRALPKLVVMKRKAKVASYRSTSNQLIIELEAYHLCKSMGVKSDAALAFLIGHELTHYYQQHDWKELGFAGTNFWLSKNTFAKQRKTEEEADIYGAFVAYLAGFEDFSVIPELLEKIYQSYALDEDLENYPSLKERKLVAAKVQQKLDELIEIYESSNYFMALGWHIQAVYGYNHILKFVKTKELYNNLGTVFLAIAIQQRKSNAYWYPLELDMDHALRNWALKTEEELLDLSRESLLRAVDLDSSYASAWVNLTAVYDLSNNEQKAAYCLSKADLYKTTLLGNAKVLLLRGVLAARKGEAEAAKAAFNKAKSYTLNAAIRTIAKHNLELLDKGYSRLAVDPMTEITDIMDRLPLLEGKPTDFDQNILLEETHFGKAILHQKKLPNSVLSCFELPNPQQPTSALFALQRSRKLSTQKKISVGNSVEQLRRVYNPLEKPYILQSRNGYFMIYRSMGLIFKVNNNERIEEWAIFMSY
jgi:hypothetical protein